MTKTIMTRAWEMYKAAGCTTRAEFGLALKAAWAESRTSKVSAETVNELNRLGQEALRAWNNSGANNERNNNQHDMNYRDIMSKMAELIENAIGVDNKTARKLALTHGRNVGTYIAGVA